jgi:2-polyprenyl-3-methyl-5-hydroxy-6-metoxy-1,4-benzoquinol methylase
MTTMIPPHTYWEQRARKFAGEGDGLRAVCSYGMPDFYNRAIDVSQRRALAPWLRVQPGTTVLDAGCGVGRWSLLLARAGAQVTGVDLSPTMVSEAGRRAAALSLAARCRFQTGDLSSLDLGRQYSLVLGVTVLQHITDEDRLSAGVDALARHVAPGGRLVLVEAAPSSRLRAWDHGAFRVRGVDAYLRLFADAGLQEVAIEGVDPVPLKILFLPTYRRLPRPLGLAGLGLATAAGLPIEWLLGRRCPGLSWHKLLVFRRPGA